MIDFAKLREIPLQRIFHFENVPPCSKDKTGKFFQSPFVNHAQKTGTLQILAKNYFSCHATGLWGDGVQFIMYLRNLSNIEAANYLLQQEGKPLPENTPYLQQGKKEVTGETGVLSLVDVQPLKTKYLLDYCAKHRGISEEVAKAVFQEILFENSNKKDFIFRGVGIPNIKGGFEIRNKFGKWQVGGKDATCIQGEGNNLTVFEGMFDYATAVEYYQKQPTNHVMILNSTSFADRLIEAIEIYDFEHIFSYLDNDESGKKVFRQIEYISTNMSMKIYPSHNDFNDFLKWKKQIIL